MSATLPEIIQASSALLDDAERAVAMFPRKWKYQLGQGIRDDALQAALLAQQAMMGRGALQGQLLLQLRARVDLLKLRMQAANRLECYRSKGHYEAQAERARSVGRQCYALLKKHHPHLIGQSAGASAPPAATRDTEYSRHPIGVTV